MHCYQQNFEKKNHPVILNESEFVYVPSAKHFFSRNILRNNHTSFDSIKRIPRFNILEEKKTLHTISWHFFTILRFVFIEHTVFFFVLDREFIWVEWKIIASFPIWLQNKVVSVSKFWMFSVSYNCILPTGMTFKIFRWK